MVQKGDASEWLTMPAIDVQHGYLEGSSGKSRFRSPVFVAKADHNKN
jgi:hypothetical protein